MTKEKDVFKNGYLDVKVNQVVRDVRKCYKPFFVVIFCLNRLAYNIINNDDVKEYKTDRDIYIYSIFGEILNAFQSSIILFERGLNDDGEIVLRCIYDKVFKMFAVINDEKNYELVTNDRNYYARKMANTIINGKQFEHLKEEAKKRDYSEVICQQTHISKWAELANMTDVYEKEYALLSSSVHCDVITLKNKIGANGTQLVINNSFDYKDLHHMLLIACDIYIKVLSAFLNYVGIKKYDRKINNIDKKIKKLDKEMGG